MSNDFQVQGRALLSNGYLILPIKPGHKRPALDNWQNSRLGAGAIGQYPGCGIGVLTGQGAVPISAVDVDTTDPALAERFTDWCRDSLGITCERVGNAPKILLVYRAESGGWAKATSVWFTDAMGGTHRLEVLGKGQQFVAYHIHPDTGLPYVWTDFFGGIECMRAGDLPVISEAQVLDAVTVFEQMAVEAGLEKKSASVRKTGSITSSFVDDPLLSYEPPVGIDLVEVKRLLEYVDNTDYETWLKAGMSLHHEYNGSDDALALWVEWSSTAVNFSNADDLAHRWRGFGVGGHRPTTARWLLMVGREGKRDALRAEKREALAETKGLIERCEDSIDLVNDVARKAGEAAGDDLALKAELAGLIRQRFKALTDTNLPVADVRAAMSGGRRLATVDKRKRQMTEFGNAERLLDAYADGLMYVPELAAWFLWTGVYWRQAAGVELDHLAKETVRALPDESKHIESDAERAEFLKFCAVSQRAIMIKNMVTLAQSDPHVVVMVSALDRDNMLLGVANGAVDLRTGDLLLPDPSHRITTTTAVEYDPDAKATLFEQTIADAFFGDMDMVRFLQRIVGYSLLGSPTEDIMVIPFGEGSNGKSTFFDTIRDVLGGYARMASAETFMETGAPGSNAGGAREDLLRLRGSRFVYVSEPSEGAELKEGLVKSMTGGEALPARGLYSKSTVEIKPTWTAFMPTNHKPIIKGGDVAIWRRLVLIPFLRNFRDDPTIAMDSKREEKLKAEHAGVLTWLVQGALEYQRIGLAPPASISQAREDYRGEMDLLREWIEECCEVGSGYTDTKARLWESWQEFSKARGQLRYISSLNALTRRLESKGFTSVTKVRKSVTDLRAGYGRGFEGIQVRDAFDFL